MADKPGSKRAQRPETGPDDDPLTKIAPHSGFVGRLRNYFLVGILITAPIAITIWIAWGVIDFFDNRITPLIPEPWNPDTYLPFSVPGLGLLLALIFLTMVGMFTAGLIGRALMDSGERLLARVPIVRSIYGSLKQVFETVLAQNSRAFRDVVLVEYPYQGVWAIGFVTSETRGEVQRVTENEVVSVFVPATPNPTTGFLLFLPREEVHQLDMTVEQGLKLVISGGIVVPPRGEPRSLPEMLRQQKPAPQRGLGFAARLRNYFLTGVLVTSPVVITFWLVWEIITFVDGQVKPLIPMNLQPTHYLPAGFPEIPGIGLLVAIAGLTVIGMFGAGIIGRAILRTSSWIFGRLPVIRSIYSALRQIVEAILASQSEAFRECVLFQYPRRGSWVIGFLTGKTEGQVQNLTDTEVINVFMPTTPNPTSGFLMFVPKNEVKPLTMTVEEGLKMVVSGGLVVPPDRGALEPEETVPQGEHQPAT
ncbi:DUF502 domain-containing protein [Fodinicurvata halophila]|uniref:DUF502 domain-containing protein n=1 Tax=Fodinicurvata halophila TaxID=1419723 RepID=A0ABV8UM17_9PROT